MADNDQRQGAAPAPAPAPDTKSPPGDEEAHASTSDARGAKKTPLLARLTKVGAATVVLLLLEIYVGHTSSGQWLQIQAYSYLERFLTDTTPERLPVVVLDIRKLPGGFQVSNPTSRQALTGIIEALRRQQAAVIGIDIDFSPAGAGFINHDKDTDFFNLCRKPGEAPVFLGVFRAALQSRDQWLGVGPYAGMAASLETPGLKNDDTLLRAVKNYEPVKGQPLPSMGYALAHAYLQQNPQARPVPPIPDMFLADGNDEGVLVNYSKLDQIRRERSVAVAPDAIDDTGEDFAGKIVLLGDNSGDHLRDDTFRPPMAERRPGVLYHASAVYTFMMEPLYEFSTLTRTGLNLLLALPFFIAAIVLHEVSKGKMVWLEHRENMVEGLAMAISLVAAVFLGLWSMLVWRIMWLEGLLAAIVLLCHISVHRFIQMGMSGFRD
ncbi:CHASE2 domain-containing protein [Paraburkholderia sediminicola]|uniref:CHASE2 domain-containing protein n=1 Tax=Paraburkholderia sediminicola TaxID=458836 RepID=UPI0038B97AD6